MTMNGLRSTVLAGALAIGGLAGLDTSPALAQTYYPAAGLYNTSAGTVYIPAPGYYNTVPSSGSYGPRGYGYTSPRAIYRPPMRSNRSGGAPANHPPHYSGALHSPQRRGFDSARHGR